jgi:hypothetical protein
MLLSLLKMAAPYLAGGGPTGMVARKAVDWVQERLEEPDEQRVTSARLVPGDRLEVVARPAPTKQERQLEARLAAAKARLAHARSIKPKQVKVAARLERTQRRLDKVAAGSSKAAKLRAREADLLVRFDRMDRRRGDRRLAEAEVIELSERLEAVRAAALAAAGGSGTTRRVFYRADD